MEQFTSLIQLMQFPVSELPVRIYERGERNPRDDPKYETEVYLSDAKYHRLEEVRLETTYTQIPVESVDTLETAIRRLLNKGIGMNRRLKRLGNPPAGIVAIGDQTLFNTGLESSLVSPPFIGCPMEFLLYVLDQKKE